MAVVFWKNTLLLVNGSLVVSRIFLLGLKYFNVVCLSDFLGFNSFFLWSILCKVWANINHFSHQPGPRTRSQKDSQQWVPVKTLKNKNIKCYLARLRIRRWSVSNEDTYFYKIFSIVSIYSVYHLHLCGGLATKCDKIYKLAINL